MTQVEKALNVSGKGDFTPKVGSFSCTVSAAVADLTVDGIIGLNFLTEYNCTVDMQKQEITIGDHNKFQMVRKGQFGCLKVGSLNTVTNPVNQEVKVPRKVCVPAGEQLLWCENITEPIQRSADDMSAGVGRSPTAGDDAVHVRMLKTTDKPFIRKDTHMTQNSAVCSMNSKQIHQNWYRISFTSKTKLVKLRMKEADRYHASQEMHR
jgi:hypothetical protein